MNVSNDTMLQAGVSIDFPSRRSFGLYGHLEKVFVDELDLISLSIGPRLTFDVSSSLFPFFPYLKAGLVFGSFDWDRAPGNFGNSVGWESGLGFHFARSQFKLGLDLLYRDITFDYAAPSGQNVSANHSSIDFSGYSLSVSFAYHF